jgi:hypothetical protein
MTRLQCGSNRPNLAIHLEAMIVEKQKEFLEDAFLSLTVRYALQRSKTYQKGAKGPNKDRFRCALKCQLRELGRQYVINVDEDSHIENIKRLAENLSEGFPDILEGGRFRIGSAQKALNLYLKYLWCADQISMPPHCPFDDLIISELPDCSDIKWTTLKDIEEYRCLVRAARKRAGEIPLAQWELEVYSDP